MNSSTGTEFIKDNHTTAGGQIHEAIIGQEVLAQLMSHPEILEKTSSIHVAGLSYGGLSALFLATNLDIHRKLSNDHDFLPRPVSGVTAVCPVINLKPTTEKLLQSRLFGNWFKNIIKDSLFALADTQNPLFSISRQQVTGLKTNRQFMSMLEEVMGKAYYSVFPPNIDLRTANNFLNVYQSLRTPATIIASEDDPIVDANLNSLMLKKVIDQSGARHSPFHFFISQKGGHCASNIASGWATFSMLLRQSIVGKDFDWQKKTLPQVRKILLDVEKPLLRKSEVLVSADFAEQTNLFQMHLVFKIWDQNKTIDGLKKCRAAHPYPYAIDSRCYRFSEQWIDMPEEVFALLPESIQSDTSLFFQRGTNAIQRWLNVNTRIGSFDGASLISGTSSSLALTFIRYP